MPEYTIPEGKYHPAADDAMRWIRSQSIEKLLGCKEAFASTAMSGNEMAGYCLSTLNRLLSGQKVSDRYLLGLAWVMRYGEGGADERG